MYVFVRPEEREQFGRCRRAWDLSARERRGLEPRRADPARALTAAVGEALAVYYFPGMWDWSRSIVRPLAVEALRAELGRQRARGDGPVDGEAWDAARRRGEALLRAYFAWAPGVDAFTPLQVATDVDAAIPDPRRPGHDLAAPDGRGVRYRVRVDMVAVDADETHWLVAHRLRAEAETWADPEVLRFDDRALAAWWAWETVFLGRLAGTVLNELRAGPVPAFRRTRLARPPGEVARFEQRLGAEARDLTDPAVRVYPNPGPATCPSCAYRPPCAAAADGGDVEQALARDYRPRPPEAEEAEGRLGSVWGIHTAPRSR